VLVRPARPSDAEPLVPVFEDWSHPLPAAAIEAPAFYAALGYENLSGRQARYSRGL
jgi:hypothetical protein